jgi:hypothetical protein
MIFPSEKMSTPRVNRLIVRILHVFIIEGFTLHYARPQNGIFGRFLRRSKTQITVRVLPFNGRLCLRLFFHFILVVFNSRVHYLSNTGFAMP